MTPFARTHSIFLVLLVALLPCMASAQNATQQPASGQTIARYDAKLLETRRIQAEMDLTEREIVSYNKELRKKRKEQEKMNDRAQHLKYKVARTLNKIDTTVEHRPTYAEWQLEKAERARDRAALYIANTEPVREQKIVQLGQKTKELTEAKADLYREPGPGSDDNYRRTNIDKPKQRKRSQKILH